MKKFKLLFVIGVVTWFFAAYDFFYVIYGVNPVIYGIFSVFFVFSGWWYLAMFVKANHALKPYEDTLDIVLDKPLPKEWR